MKCLIYNFNGIIFRMKFLFAFVSLVVLMTVNANKDTQDSQLSMVLVKALQSQLKTCMDQNRDLVQRSCQKPGHWGGRVNLKFSIFYCIKPRSMLIHSLFVFLTILYMLYTHDMNARLLPKVMFPVCHINLY